jgi:hypothetical protein
MSNYKNYLKERRGEFVALQKIADIKERFFDFLIENDVANRDAEYMAKYLSFSTVIKSNEFSEAEKKFAKKLEKQFAPLEKYSHLF